MVFHSVPLSHLPTTIHRAGFPGGSGILEFQGGVAILTGVAKTAGQSPGSADKFRNNPIGQDSFTGFKFSQNNQEPDIRYLQIILSVKKNLLRPSF